MKADIPIIFEDANILVINKPAGLTVHGDGFGKQETLVDWLMKKYPEIEGVGEEMEPSTPLRHGFVGQRIKKPGIIHRLDKETSGVMIVAKTQEAFLFFKKQFQNHEVKKIYRAILSGHVNFPVGEEKVLNWPIGRSSNDPRIRVARSGGKGKLREAVTIFRLLENICSNYALVEAEPKSGRTHQLRAHFKAYNHPIIGDSLYNPNNNGEGAIERTALHAFSLTVKLPCFVANSAEASLAKKTTQGEAKGEEMTFVAPLASDFEAALEKLKASC
ncbi:MAG: RluA family pseudouridine synthase [Candidatus Paceibacterota bacterium]|jgi:23S rRNA pseudouridine1911/1915/1917 synthase